MATVGALAGGAMLALRIRTQQGRDDASLLQRRDALLREVDVGRDRFLGRAVGSYLLVRAVDRWRGADEYLACPTASYDLEQSVTVLLCESTPRAMLPQAIERWLQVRHPLFLPVLDWGVLEEGHYVVFRRPEATLRSRLPVPQQELAALVVPLLEGLALIDPGQFGLDDLWMDGPGPRLAFLWRPAADPTHCQAGASLADLNLAPEEVQSGPHERASQFRAGTVIYQALTGRHPFLQPDGDLISSLFALLSQDPPPLNLDNPALEAFVLRLLSKRPEDRYTDLAAAREAFRETL